MIKPRILIISSFFVSSFAFFFPDKEDLNFKQDAREGRGVNGPQITPCAEGALWCEEVDFYPYVRVPDQVTTLEYVKDRIFDSSGPLTRRFGGDYDDEEGSSLVQESRACDHRKSIVYPKKARNIDGAFMFIVNDDKYKQAVSIEQCLGEGEECRNQDDAPSFGTTVCRQKYTTYKLYVINEKGEQVFDSFSLPSACLCHHRSNFAIRILDNSLDYLELPQCRRAEALAIPSSSFAHSFSSSTSKPKSTSASSAISFKDKRKKRDASACDSNGNFCEDDQDYPEDLMLAALQKTPVLTDALFHQLFDSDCRDQEIQSRGLFLDEEQLCYGRKNIIFPKKAKNLREEWKFVVNIDNYTQSVEVEECDNGTLAEDFGRDIYDSNDFGVCLYSGAGGDNPDLTVCRQLFTEHKLLALTSEGQLEVDSFQLPSACSCFVREEFFDILEFRDGMDKVEELPPQVEEVTKSGFLFGG